MRRTTGIALVAVAALSAPALAVRDQTVRPTPPAAPDTTGRLTVDALVDIKHPSAPIWSRDASWVAFMWDRGGVSNLYVVPADGSKKPTAITTDGAAVNGMFWSADSRAIYFTRDGALMRASVDATGPPTRLWSIGRFLAASPDGTAVAYVVGGDRGGGTPAVHLRSLADDKDTVVASLAGLGVVAWRDVETLVLVVPTPGDVVFRDQSPAYSGAKIIFRTVEGLPPAAPSQGYVLSLKSGTLTKLATTTGGRFIDDTHLLAERIAPDFKRRTISLVDATNSQETLLHEDVKSTFWSVPPQAQAGSQPSPDRQWISYLSDRDGFDHLYVMRASGGDPVQITKGRFEAWRPAWSSDSTRIAFDSNEGANPGSRHIGIATIGSDPSRASIRMLTSGRGVDVQPVWSPDGRKILYQRSDPQNSADFYVVDATAEGSKPVRLTESMPAGIDKTQLVEPELVHYPGADGQMVAAYLFVPKTLDRATKHPAIVWVHGDGINQNYDGWHVQRNYAVYYSVHQYLLQQGFVVITPDYRGSIGYGSAWRDGQYMDLGGKDFRDASMSADYLKTLSYVDANRIGIWGLSYGGFITLKALTDMPATFACGVNVAGAVDWAMYYDDPYHGTWTSSRVGTPEEHPQVYAQASPLSHVDRLARPLLILHGTADANVPYLHSVRLVDELLKKGKGDLVTFMTYPGEFHYFSREHVLRDAWTRVAAFFKENLRP